MWVLPLRKVRNSDSGGDLRETHGRRADSAVGIWKRTTYGRYTGWNNLREPHGNRDGSALHRRTVGEGTDGRSGVWMVSGLSREDIRVKSEE